MIARQLIFLLLCLIAFSPALAADMGKDERPKEFTTLLDLKGSLSESAQKQRASNTRTKVLSDTAQTLAFQQGFKWRYDQLFTAAEARSYEFDRSFNFGALLIDNRVLPPVIQWADKAVNIESDDYATSVEAQYRIVQPARIVSTPPNWRGYLMMDAETLTASPDIYPNTSDERDAWRRGVEKGWNEGVEHAGDVFVMNMDRLTTDYRGILRFKILADTGLVSVPVLAQGNIGVQVGKDVLNIDQRTFRITVPAAFRAAEFRK